MKDYSSVDISKYVFFLLLLLLLLSCIVSVLFFVRRYKNSVLSEALVRLVYVVRVYLLNVRVLTGLYFSATLAMVLSLNSSGSDSSVISCEAE